MNIRSSLRALVAGSIDYAGMFPPATLELESAIRNYAAYARSDEAWMLASFVLPIGRFSEAKGLLSEFNEQHPLRLSALGAKTGNKAELTEQLQKLVTHVEDANDGRQRPMRIDQVELPLLDGVDAATLALARDSLTTIDGMVFWETPANDAAIAIEVLAAENQRAGRHRFGFKLRTGGVTADAFPESAHIARALIASAANGLPIKFTAGLHHPVRMFREEVETKMHGFLNVFGAGVLAVEHRWNEDQALAMLEDEDPNSFSFTEDRFRWRNWEIATARIAQYRELITSFGSCSFDEPRHDLRALGLLN